jgi:hypothetical protein
MKNTVRQSRHVFMATGMFFLSTLGALAQPTIDLLAVRINDTPITPTAIVTAFPGDTIETEIWLRDWSPNGERLRGYCIALDGGSFESGLCGEVAKVGPETLVPECQCFDDSNCASCQPGTVCNTEWQSCMVPGYDDSNISDFIACDHPDFVFSPCDDDVFVQLPITEPNELQHCASVFDPNEAVPYSAPKYAGTVVLGVSPDAGGIFKIAMRPELFPGGPVITYMLDELGCHIPNENCADAAPALIPLTVNVNADCPIIDPICPISANPSNCAIDARQPSAPDGTLPAGWNFLDLEFPHDPSGSSILEFQVREVPAGTPPGIFRITQRDGEIIRISFDRRITPGNWTCVYTEAGDCVGWREICIAHLPGDVNGDGTAGAADILSLIDCLNGVRTCELQQCDIDRSGVCGPPDILRTIDVLNGAGAYEPWLNRSLPLCPSRP